MHVNLFPPEIILKKTLRRLGRIWLASLAIGLAVLAATCGGKYWQVAQGREEVRQANANTQEIQQLATETVGRERELHDLESRLAALNELRAHRRAVALLGVIAQSVQAASGQMRLNAVDLQLAASKEQARGPESPAGDANARGGGTATFGGQVEDAAAISRLLAHLRGLSVFSQVELKGSVATSGPSLKSRQFQVECKF